MVAIGLSARAVARIRFAVSCLWETVAGVRVLRDPRRHAVHLPWVSKVHGRLVDAGLVGDRGGLLWQLIPAEPRYLPDFLTPVPHGLAADLDADLAALLATPAERVRGDLDVFSGAGSAAVRELYADPETGLRRLAAEITAYWRLAVAPDWARLRMLLDADIHHRARTVAEAGTDGLLNDLHQRIRWEGDMVSVAQPYCSAPDIPLGGGLVLIPSIFVWPSVLSVASDGVSQLAYPARGAATLWEGVPEAPDPLSAVIGRGRARLLAEMRSPLSTTELARRTGMSAGGVSQHLAALRAAGLVATHRRGRSVLNARTGTAEVLLSAAPGLIPDVSSPQRCAVDDRRDRLDLDQQVGS
jgi:DNA-binding transcriptional ArsR family regulator